MFEEVRYNANGFNMNQGYSTLGGSHHEYTHKKNHIF